MNKYKQLLEEFKKEFPASERCYYAEDFAQWLDSREDKEYEHNHKNENIFGQDEFMNRLYGCGCVETFDEDGVATFSKYKGTKNIPTKEHTLCIKL